MAQILRRMLPKPPKTSQKQAKMRLKTLKMRPTAQILHPYRQGVQKLTCHLCRKLHPKGLHPKKLHPNLQ